MLKIPNKWFFLDVKVKKSTRMFHTITDKYGIIFYNKEYHKNSILHNETNQLMNICKSKNISFLLYGSVSAAIKNKALGIYMPLDQYSSKTKNKLDYINNKSKIIYATSVHNKKEILISNKLKYDLVFISPAFKTKTHIDMRPHNPIKFISLSKYPNSKIFALGGVNDSNYRFLKNKHLKGFGAITYFNDLKKKIN